MNIKEADLSYLASPAIAPNGPELSGPQSDLSTQEISSLVENAPVIVASHLALERLKTYANIIGEQGARVSQKARRAIGVLVVPVIAFAAACGSGADANASTSGAKETQPPAAEFNLTTVPTKVATDAPKVVITEGPKALLTPEPAKVLSPAEVNALIDAALASTPDSYMKTNIKNAADNALVQITQGGMERSAINNYGQAGKWIAELACVRVDDVKLSEAFYAVKGMNIAYVKDKEKSGMFNAGYSDFVSRTFFTVPLGCQNKGMLEGSK